jgi:hypothetical protein
MIHASTICLLTTRSKLSVRMFECPPAADIWTSRCPTMRPAPGRGALTATRRDRGSMHRPTASTEQEGVSHALCP